MQARMKNPAIVLGAFEPAQALYKAAYTSGLDQATLELVHLRVSPRRRLPAWWWR